MELFPNFKERGEKGLEGLEGLKKSVIEICKQLRNGIEEGRWDALVSDDTGGRIPTLLLREIFKNVNPNYGFNTLFIASGRRYRPRSRDEHIKLSEYLDRGLGNAVHALLITQYIHSGNTIGHLVQELKEKGVETVDVVSIYANTPKVLDITNADNIYLGGFHDKRQSGFTEDHHIPSGIYKNRQYNPTPKTLKKSFRDGDIKRSDLLSFGEYDTLADVKQYEPFETRRNKRIAFSGRLDELDEMPLTDEEKEIIQENILRTRNAIKKVAQDIIKEVWGI